MPNADASVPLNKGDALPASLHPHYTPVAKGTLCGSVISDCSMEQVR